MELNSEQVLHYKQQLRKNECFDKQQQKVQIFIPIRSKQLKLHVTTLVESQCLYNVLLQLLGAVEEERVTLLNEGDMIILVSVVAGGSVLILLISRFGKFASKIEK